MSRRKAVNLREDDLSEIMEAAEEYIRCRRLTVSTLICIAEQLRRMQTDVTIAKFLGSMTFTMGSGVAAFGLLSSIFSFGATLPLVAIGAGIGAAGGFTTTISGFLNDLRSWLFTPDVSEALGHDQCSVERLVSALRKASFTAKAVEALEIADNRATAEVDLVASSRLRIYQVPSLSRGRPATTKQGAESWIVEVPLDLNKLIMNSVNNKHSSVYEVADAISSLAEFIRCPEDWDFCKLESWNPKRPAGYWDVPVHIVN